MTRISIILLCFFIIQTGCSKQAPEHTLIAPAGDVIKVPLNEVNDGGVHFYTYKYEGKNINFFVRSDSKGKLHTHYDACYSCYKYKLGFKVVGNDLLCIACGLKYSLSDESWDFIGPCSPIPLRSRVKGEFIVIQLSVIHRGYKLF